MSAHGRVIWSELNSHHPEAARSFLGETLGWSFESVAIPGGGTYGIIKLGEERVGGLFTMNGLEFEAVPDHWLTYIGVDDVDGRVSAAVEAGATVLRDPWTIEGVGRVALLRGPGSGVMAWMTPVMSASKPEADRAA
jgi:uncharacterized protein